MIASKSLESPHFRDVARRPWPALAALVCLALCASTAGAQDRARPDQILWLNNRSQVQSLSGVISSNELDKLVIDAGGREREVPSAQIVRIVWGDVPSSYRDGERYQDRGEFENAAAKFALAASDDDARGVVQAAARLRAAHCFMLLGAADASGYAQALAEIDRFTSEFDSDRAAPAARELKGRAQLLAGSFAEAAATYRSLFGELQAQTEGYAPLLCLRAGTHAVEAFLLAGDTLQAREVNKELEGALPTILAEIADDDPLRSDYVALQARVRLGEGYALLAANDVVQAKAFFQGQLSAAQNAAHRFGSLLGLAEAQLRQGNYRDAQLEFAEVAAIDYTDRDRTARALVGLAESALKLGDTNAKVQARTWLQTVQSEYGDTPSVLKAKELLGTL